MTRPTLIAAALLLPATLLAQRDDPTLAWEKRNTTIAYGAVPVGRHTLAELEIGGTWRLGMNEASTWSTEMPLLVGDRLLPPGEYRVNLQRLDEKRCALVANGSGLALGGGGDVRVEGELADAKKKTKKLELEWEKGATKDQPGLGATIHVRFGEHAWSGETTLLGGKTTKLGKFQLTVFTVPAKLVEGRKTSPVPVATLSKGKAKSLEAWNLVLNGDEAKLVPWMTAPTDSFGFGEIEPPDGERTSTGSVAAADAQVDEPIAALELVASSLDKDRIEVVLRAGKETLTVAIDVPPDGK